MSIELFEHLKVLELYLENKNQKVILCMDKNTEELYLLNVILNKKIIEAINLQELRKVLTSIDRIAETENEVYILSRYYNFSKLKDYIHKNKVSLSKQIAYIMDVFDKLTKLKGYPLFISSSIINHNNMYIDEHKNLRTMDLIVTDYDYMDKSKSQIYNEIANIMHIVFAGCEIKDSKLSDELPPDVERIIRNCLNNEYLKYDDLVNDFKTSKLYRLINPEIEESKKVHAIRRNLYKRRTKFKIRKKALVLAIILILLLPIGILYSDRIFDKFKDIETVDNEYTDDEIKDDNKNTGTGERDDNIIDDKEEDQYSNDELATSEENILYYFNTQKVEESKANYYGELDNEIYYDGDISIKATNLEDKKQDFFTGRIDTNEDYFDFIKGRKIDLSMRILSDKGEDVVITVKVFNQDKLLSEISKRFYVNKDIWTLQNLNIDIGNGEYLDIFVTTYEKGNIWVDAYSLDILK